MCRSKRLDVDSRVVDQLGHAMRECFLDELDEAAVDGADNLRSYLIDRVLHSASSRRLANLPVPTQLVVQSYGPPDVECKPSEHFFPGLATISQSLRQYQPPAWVMAERFAPLVVQTIDLKLLDVPLTSKFFQDAATALRNGLSMSCSKVTLSIRSVECKEEELGAFLDALVANSTHTKPINITTGPPVRPFGQPRVQDVETKVTVLLRCIGHMKYPVSVDVSGLLGFSETREEIRAVYRGIVQYLLPRSSLASLIIRTISFVADNAEDFHQEVFQWRQDHPDKKLRVQMLKLWLEDGSMPTMPTIRVILDTLDDAENISISMSGTSYITADDIRTILWFPSLRTASLINVSIPSMDVFLSGNISQFHLETLMLGGLNLEDSASMVAFVKSLDPHSDAASSLSRSLQTLSIAEVDGSDFDDGNESGRRVKPKLAVNAIAAVPALEDILRTNQTLRYANFIGDFGQRPVVPATGSEYPTRISHVVAPASVRRGALEKARKAAFLSGLHEGNCATARVMDSNIIRQIFEFSAPHVPRKVRV